MDELLRSPVAPPLIDTSTPPSALAARRRSMGHRRDSFAPPSAELTGQLRGMSTPADDATPQPSVGSGALLAWMHIPSYGRDVTGLRCAAKHALSVKQPRLRIAHIRS